MDVDDDDDTDDTDDDVNATPGNEGVSSPRGARHSVGSVGSTLPVDENELAAYGFSYVDVPDDVYVPYAPPHDAATGEVEYDPALEGFDVGVRAVVNLYHSGHWPLLADVGVTLSEHDRALRAALDANVRGYRLRTHGQVRECVQRCPFLLEAVVALYTQYFARCSTTRQAWHEALAMTDAERAAWLRSLTPLL